MLYSKLFLQLGKYSRVTFGRYRQRGNLPAHVSLRSFILSLAICFAIPATAFAETKVKIGQTEPVYFPFHHNDFNEIQRGRLQATLGNYDITSLVSYDASGLYLNLNSAVESGTYPLYIAIITPDNQSTVLVSQAITFVDSERNGGVEFRSNTAYRVAESDTDDFSQTVKRLTESAMRLQAKHLSPKTSIHSYADFQHRSDGNTLSGDKLEIANFQIGLLQKTAIGNLGFSLGNQNIEQQGLVFNGFNRRGVSAELSGDKNHYHMKTFFINSDPEVSSKEKVILATDKREKSSGATFDIDVFSTEPGRLRVSGGYIDGQSELGGIGIGYTSAFHPSNSSPIAYGGHAWSVSASSAWWENALTLQAEQAKSYFDSDGLEVGDAARKDKASLYAITLGSLGPLAKFFSPLHINTWQFHWQRQTVGEYFFSLANFGLPGDLRTDRTSMQINWSQVQISAEHYLAQNNVNNRTDTATQTTVKHQVVTNYMPIISNDTVFWRSVGRPSFSINLSQTQREQSEQDSIFSGYNLDDITEDYQLSAFFQGDTFNWSLQHGETRYKNHAYTLMDGGFIFFQPAPNTKNQYTSASLNLKPTKNISLFPTLQRSDYREAQTNNHQNAFNFGLSANMRMFRNRLDLNFNYNRSEQATTYTENPSLEYQNEHASLVANWQAIQPKSVNPGLKISLRHVWNEQTASFQSTHDDYQVLLSMELYWEKGRLQ